MPDLTPEQEQERLRLIQQQNEAANELLSTYEKLSTSVEQLKNDEKELVSLSKQLIESSVKVEGSLEKRSETLTSIVNLSKSLNKETLDYNKSLTESVKLKDKLSATTAAKPIVKAPTLPETTTQTVTPNINVEVPELTVTPKLKLGDIPELIVTPNLVLSATPQLTIVPNLVVAPVPTQSVTPNLAVEAAPLQTVIPNIQVLPAPQQTITPDVVLGATPQLLVTPNIALADVQPQVVTPNIQLLPTPVQTVTPNFILGPIPQLTVTPNLVAEATSLVVTPNITVTEAPQQTVTPNLVVGPVPQLQVIPNLSLGITPQLMVTPNLALEPSPVQTVVPNLVLGPIPQLTITPNLVADTNPISVAPNFVVAEAPAQIVTPNLVLGPVPQINVTPNLVVNATPQLIVTPNIAVAEAPAQTVIPNIVLGPIPQLTITPNLVADANPISVTPNFVVADTPQQTVTPNLVVADPLAPLSVTPNLQLVPQSEPLFVTPRLLQKPVLDPLFVTPNFKLVPPTEPIEVTPNFQLATLSPLTVTPEIQVQTPVLTVTPEVNVVNPTVTTGGTAAGAVASSFPFDKAQLIAIQKDGISLALKKYERSPSLGVTLDKDKSNNPKLLDKLLTAANGIYSIVKQQIKNAVKPSTVSSTATAPAVAAGNTPPSLAVRLAAFKAKKAAPAAAPVNTGTTPTTAPPLPVTPNLSPQLNVAKDLAITSEQLLDSSNQIIDSTKTRSKLIKGITADEQMYLASIKQQQKLSQNIAANAENYENFQVKSKELDKQITTAKSNANKADLGFSKIEQKLITDRIQAGQNALNLYKREIALKQELKDLDGETADFQIRRQDAIRAGNTSLAASLAGQIKANQYNAGLKEKAIKDTGAQLQREIEIRKTAGEVLKQAKIGQQLQAEEIALLNQNLDIRKRIEKSTGLLGGIAKAASKIPGIGQYLNADEAINEMEKLAAEIEKGGGKSTSFSNRLQIGLKGVSTLAKGLMENLKSPEAIFTFIITSAFKANQQVVELGKSLGLSAAAAEDMRQGMAQFARESGDTFVTTDRLLKAQTELSEQLGIAVQFSNEELVSFAKLTELTGLSAQEAGKLANNSAAAGVNIEDYTKGIREGAFSAMQATKTHFSMKEVLQDVSKLSSGILVKFQNNPKAIAQAVIEAKKLGTNLETIDKIGDSLLDWESSLNNELDAELMTGKQLNMERARAAALTGDQLTLTREISSQVGTLNDYQHMNVLAQESLAKAFGMSRDSMSEMLMKQEAVAKYGDKAAELNKEQLEDMKRQGLSADEYLKKQEQQRAAQDKFKDAMSKIQDIIGNLVAGPVGQLLDALANVVGIVMKILSVFTPILRVVSWIAEGVSDLLNHWYILYPLIGLVAVGYLPKLVEGFNSILGSVTNIGKGIIDAFSGKGLDGFFDKIKEGFGDKASDTISDKATEKAESLVESTVSPEDITAKAESTTTKADNIGKGSGKSFKAKMKDIAAGLKEFADVKVLLGALNLIPASIGLTAMIPGAIGAKILNTIDGKKVKEALKGIASGLVEFGKNNILLGSLNLVVASAGLTAMIPGAIGAKILSSIDGKKLKESLKAISSGIESFGKASLVLGAVNMLVAAIGLTAMIPGAIGAKIITQIDGKKFQKSMEGIATGIQSFAKGSILLGAGAMTIAAIGLTAMIPGAIGAKMITQVSSVKFQKSMEGLAAGIESFGKGKVVLGSLNMVIASVGLVAMIPGAIGAAMISKVNSNKFQKAMEGMAAGIQSFGKGNIALGSLNLVLAAVGLTAMIPGAIGATIISKINGDKLKKTLNNIAEGISSFGKGGILLGAINLGIAAIGLTAMIPGYLGIKLLEIVNGDKFQSAMEGIANGISAFGENVTLGAIGKLALGGVALDLFALGTPGILLLQLVNGDKFQSAMKGIGAGIASFGENTTLGAIAKLALGGIALDLFALGVPGLLLLQLVNGTLIEKTLGGIGKGIAAFSQNVSYGDLLKGAVAIALLGASLIPFTYAVGLMANIDPSTILIGVGALAALAGVAYLVSKASSDMLMGSIAIAVLGVALIPFTYALSLLADVKMENILAAGAGLLIFGAAVFGLGALMFTGVGALLFGAGILALIALGGAMIILGTGLKVVSEGGAGIAQLFQQLSELDATKLDAVAPALKTIGEAIMYLGAGGVMSAIGKLLGGDSPSKMITDIAASADGITKAASGIQTMASSITQLSTALASLDISKLEKIAEMSSGGGVTGFLNNMFNKITSVVGIGESPSSTPTATTTPISSPASSATATTTNQASIQPNVDLTPMIAAINEVKSAVDRLYGKDTSINMDGKKVGTTLSQKSYKVA